MDERLAAHDDRQDWDLPDWLFDDEGVMIREVEDAEDDPEPEGVGEGPFWGSLPARVDATGAGHEAPTRAG